MDMRVGTPSSAAGFLLSEAAAAAQSVPKSGSTIHCRTRRHRPNVPNFWSSKAANSGVSYCCSPAVEEIGSVTLPLCCAVEWVVNGTDPDYCGRFRAVSSSLR